MNGNQSSTINGSDLWRESRNFRTNSESQSSGINKSKLSVSDLNRINSTVRTTKHCFDSVVVLMSSNNIQSSFIGILAVLIVWRYLRTKSNQSNIHSEFTWIVDWEWEVGFNFERDFRFQHW